MEKKIWSTPVANVEQFLANEYVAQVCWKIACAWGEQASFDEGHWANGQEHTKTEDGSGCGWDVNQYIVEHADNRFTMVEINNNDYDDLNCRLYESTTNQNGQVNNWGKVVDFWSNLQDKQHVYWETNVGKFGYTVWMKHYGQVQFTNSTGTRS